LPASMAGARLGAGGAGHPPVGYGGRS
jgi:hypothetical protein